MKKSEVPSLLIATATLIAGVLVGSSLDLPLNPDVVTSIAHVFIAVAAILGLTQIWISKNDSERKLKQETHMLAMAQIRFFRETILKAHSTFTSAVNTQAIQDNLAVLDFKYTMPHPSPFSFTQEGLNTECLDNLFSSHYANYKREVSSPQNIDIKAAQVNLINALEEFALNILTFDLEQHESMAAVKKLFLGDIRENSFFLYHEILDIGNNFTHVVSLYNAWKN